MEYRHLPDLLIFMSDQHTSYFSGFYGHQVDTPNLDALCRDGVEFSECYTANPLCGPARSCLLSGIRSAKSGLFHRSAMANTTPTFLHLLVEAGYETTLIGRMHFIGADQYHGFLNHLAGDMTPVTWNYDFAREQMRKERGVFVRTDTFSGRGATSISGGGSSPVLNYDRHVAEAALQYFQQEHDRPQCVFVSIYGPHFPYVAPKELYLKYMKKVTLSRSFSADVPCEFLKRFQSDVTEEVAKSCMAAYCGMIENVDRQFGLVKDAFENFAARRGSKKLTVYLSDHGDQCGDRRIFGKETFYEKSVKIPFIFTGDGVVQNYRCETPVSIMDIGPTLLEFVGAQDLPEADGVSLVSALKGEPLNGRPVISEYMYRLDERPFFLPDAPDTRYCHGLMVRLGHYKYITYQGFPEGECLFDISEDPDELRNLAGKLPDVLQRFRLLAKDLKMEGQAQKNYRLQSRVEQLMQCYEKVKGDPDQRMRWKDNPPDAAVFPEICVKNPAFFTDG